MDAYPVFIYKRASIHYFVQFWEPAVFEHELQEAIIPVEAVIEECAVHERDFDLVGLVECGEHSELRCFGDGADGDGDFGIGQARVGVYFKRCFVKGTAREGNGWDLAAAFLQEVFRAVDEGFGQGVLCLFDEVLELGILCVVVERFEDGYVIAALCDDAVETRGFEIVKRLFVHDILEEFACFFVESFKNRHMIPPFL